jgi:hypothetical protein
MDITQDIQDMIFGDTDIGADLVPPVADIQLSEEDTLRSAEAPKKRKKASPVTPNKKVKTEPNTPKSTNRNVIRLF